MLGVVSHRRLIATFPGLFVSSLPDYADGTDAIQVLDVVDDIKNQGLLPPTRSRSVSLHYGNGRTKQDHTADVIHVNNLIKHIDGKRELKVVTVILFGTLKCSIGFGVIRVNRVDVRVGIDLAEPLGNMPHQILQILIIGTEHDILPSSIDHVPVV